MKKRRNDRGAAMVMVIVVIAFVSILVATLFMMSTINIQMKSVDRKAKENFYSAEGALEQINLGLQNEISDASSDAYVYIMQNYAGTTLAVERKRNFNLKFYAGLKDRIHETGDVNKYDMSKLESYLSADLATHTVLSSTGSCRLVEDTEGLVLKGLVVTYTNDENFQTVIETDIRLSAPDLNLLQPSDLPEFFDYCIVANRKLEGKNSGEVTVGADVYAGEDGMLFANGSNWRFQQAKRLVVKGDIQIPKTAALNVENDMDLWANELDIKGGTLQTKGRTYVANDLVMSDRGSSVTLEGEYYGYGNGTPLNDGGIVLSPGGDSSAILINGTQTSLDMSNIRKLLLSGSAEIATGSETFDRDHVENILPDRDPSLNTLVTEKTVVLKSGAYTLESVSTDLLVRSEEEYLHAATVPPADGRVGENAWERFLLVNNSDGTVSFKDRNLNKYVSVQEGSPSILKATADSAGLYERFTLHLIQGKTGHYVLKAVVNGKYVTEEDCTVNGAVVPHVLCANRDKVTDDSQLFKIKRVGDIPDDPILPPLTEPVITFTYLNTSRIRIAFATPSWMENKSADEAWAEIHYKVWGENQYTKMSISEDGQYAYIEIQTTSGMNQISYTVNFLNKEDIENYNGSNLDSDRAYIDAHKHSVSAIYDQSKGINGNSSEGGTWMDGVYTWQSRNPNAYCKAGNSGKDVLTFTGDKPAYNDNDSEEKFILIYNEEDNTVSLRTMAPGAKYKYVSIQEDGTLLSNSDSVGVNEKFKLVYATEQKEQWYYIQTLEDSLGKGKYVWANANNKRAEIAKTFDRWDLKFMFYFQWNGYTDKTGEIETPEEPIVIVDDTPKAAMVYNTETTAKTTFTSPHWTGASGEKVTMYYTVNDGEQQTVSMNKSDREATYIVNGLVHLDKVTYWFDYTFLDEHGSHTSTTPKSIYIHETLYGNPVHVTESNVNISLGESLEVKSNQIAYLVPPECIGVNDGETLIGKNPLTAAEYVKMMSYAENSLRYPDFEVVSFTKTVEGLGRNLSGYRTPGTDGYRTIFVQTSDGTMVYFYVDFDSDNASAYFRDYYAEHQNILEQYMREYINKIELNGYLTRLTADGNLMYSSGSNILLQSNVNHGAYQTVAQKNAQINEETGYQKSFKALSSKLTVNYAGLTTREKQRDTFDNLIRYSDAGDSDSDAFAGIPNNTVPITYSTDDGEVRALILNNKDKAAYRYNSSSDPEKKVCLILATGDVVLEQDFSGIVIAKGTVTVANSSVNRVNGDKENLKKILQTKVDPADPASKTILQRYFRNGDSYSLEESGEGTVFRGDYISYTDLVTYEDWTKR